MVKFLNKSKIMKTFLRFTDQSFHKYNNAEYTNCLDRICNLTISTGAAVLHYEQADIDRLVHLLSLMQDLVSRNMASMETDQLQELELLRDEVGRYIIDTVRNSLNLPFPEIAAASKALWFVLKPYVGFYSLPNMQETTVIEGMVMDLHKPENAPYVTALSLDGKVAELAEANAQYKAITDQRTGSRNAAKTADSKTLRLEIDALYECITTVAFAYSVVTPSDAIAQYISMVNAIINEANTAYNQRMGLTKKTDGETPLPPATDSGTTTPTEPEIPGTGGDDNGGTTPTPDPTPDPDTGGDDDDDEGGLAG